MAGIMEKNKVYIKTFGGFDVYVNDRIIYFPNLKAKELLAYLVDQKGIGKDLFQISQVLYEDANTENGLNASRVAYHRLHKILIDNGIDYIIHNAKGKNKRSIYRLIECEVVCDYYELEKRQNIILFHGAYMPDYSWAEYTQAQLIKYFK